MAKVIVYGEDGGDEDHQIVLIHGRVVHLTWCLCKCKCGASIESTTGKQKQCGRCMMGIHLEDR